MTNQQEESQRIWENIAGFWDEKIGEAGNAWHQLMVAPNVLDLLGLQTGERVVEAACGNGQFARQLARMGIHVTAFDFAPTFIERAQAHSADLNIDYHVINAMDEAAMRALGEGQFDAMATNMALMDIADIQPLFNAAFHLLRPGGRLVFSVTHPCFNHVAVTQVEELSDDGTTIRSHFAAKVNRYLSLDGTGNRGIGISGQPEPHLYFDRTFTSYLTPAFAAGLVLDGMREPTFPPEHESRWQGYYREIPPLWVGRLRKPA